MTNKVGYLVVYELLHGQNCLLYSRCIFGYIQIPGERDAMRIDLTYNEGRDIEQLAYPLGGYIASNTTVNVAVVGLEFLGHVVDDFAAGGFHVELLLSIDVRNGAAADGS